MDKKIKWGLTHQINPDIDTEREFILNDLKESGVMENYKKAQFVDPILGTNFAGDLFFTDGEGYVVYFE